MQNLGGKSHGYAIQIEQILCELLGCKRGGLGGYVNADCIEGKVKDGFIIGLSYAYKAGKKEEVESFLAYYPEEMEKSIYEILKQPDGEKKMDEIINKFEDLIRA